MSARTYATVGRAGDNDVVLDDATVSSHHARLSWQGSALVIEDLSSANGTFVDGKRIRNARTRPGVELRLGQVLLPWGHPGLRELLKAGVGQRTMPMPEGGLPAAKPKVQQNAGSAWITWVMLLPAIGAVAGAYDYFVRDEQARPMPVPTSVTEVREVLDTLKADTRIGGQTAGLIAKSFTPMDPVTRNTAVKIAARTEGPFHVEQVAEIWNAVRRDWKYVNDPEGREYFATATETIQNGYIGDCDDFAIALASMVSAIGGKARVVLMDGPRGGHAYAEACVQGEPKKVAAALTKHYKNRWRRYISGAIPTTIAFRSSEECPIWLNLDWNSVVPGGAYEPEVWAVAVYPDARSETLAPAAPAAPTPPKAN
jgi:transglutaminase-like putative cysteine protease